MKGLRTILQMKDQFVIHWEGETLALSFNTREEAFKYLLILAHAGGPRVDIKSAA